MNKKIKIAFASMLAVLAVGVCASPYGTNL